MSEETVAKKNSKGRRTIQEDDIGSEAPPAVASTAAGERKAKGKGKEAVTASGSAPTPPTTVETDPTHHGPAAPAASASTSAIATASASAPMFLPKAVERRRPVPGSAVAQAGASSTPDRSNQRGDSGSSSRGGGTGGASGRGGSSRGGGRGGHHHHHQQSNFRQSEGIFGGSAVHLPKQSAAAISANSVPQVISVSDVAVGQGYIDVNKMESSGARVKSEPGGGDTQLLAFADHMMAPREINSDDENDFDLIPDDVMERAMLPTTFDMARKKIRESNRKPVLPATTDLTVDAASLAHLDTATQADCAPLLNNPSNPPQLIFLQFPDVLPLPGVPPVINVEAAANPGLEDSEMPPPALFAHLDEGLLGQLKVYKSGKIKLVLSGGLKLEVSAGTVSDFAQTAALLNKDEQTLAVLGSVNHRYLCTPDIDSILA